MKKFENFARSRVARCCVTLEPATLSAAASEQKTHVITENRGKESQQQQPPPTPQQRPKLVPVIKRSLGSGTRPGVIFITILSPGEKGEPSRQHIKKPFPISSFPKTTHAIARPLAARSHGSFYFSLYAFKRVRAKRVAASLLLPDGTI